MLFVDIYHYDIHASVTAWDLLQGTTVCCSIKLLGLFVFSSLGSNSCRLCCSAGMFLLYLPLTCSFFVVLWEGACVLLHLLPALGRLFIIDGTSIMWVGYFYYLLISLLSIVGCIMNVQVYFQPCIYLK